MRKLSGKVAIATGASRGIGKAIALALAREGANVAFCARTEHYAESQWPGTIAQTADEIRALGVKAFPFRCDLSIHDEVVNFYNAAIKEFGRVDILINNAVYNGPGIYGGFLEVDDEVWQKSFAINVLAAVYGCRVAVPQMVKQRGGIIVFITSGSATFEMQLMPDQTKASVGAAYPSSKAAQIRLIASLAKEMKPHNISVIGLDPGSTLTERLQQDSPNTTIRHSTAVPASTAAYLCTSTNPMQYTGANVIAADFVKENNLL